MSRTAVNTPIPSRRQRDAEAVTAAEKYPSVSPYAFCLDNPLRNIDQNGDSVCVLNAPDGASFLPTETLTFGHLGILIQDEGHNWVLYSKNGTNQSFGISGPGTDDDMGNSEVVYKTPHDFMVSPMNFMYGKPYYTEDYVIPSTSVQDKKATDAFLNALKEGYRLTDRNCSDAVRTALRAAGLKDGNKDIYKFFNNFEPRDVFKNIKKYNNGHSVWPIEYIE